MLNYLQTTSLRPFQLPLSPTEHHATAWACTLASTYQTTHNENLESAQDGGDALLQVIPSLVASMDHLLEAARRVGAILSGQAAVLLVDQL